MIFMGLDVLLVLGLIGGSLYFSKKGLEKLASKMCKKCKSFIWSDGDVVTCPKCGHVQVR